MNLVNMVDLLNYVKKGEATAAFNFIGLDDFKGIVCAAERQQVPVILQVSQSTAAQIGLDYAAALTRVAASKAQSRSAFIWIMRQALTLFRRQYRADSRP